MGRKKFFKTNAGRLLTLLVVFAIIVVFASLLFAAGVEFKRRTLFLRIVYMAAAVLWVFFTVRWLCVKYEFAGLWHGLIDEFHGHEEDFVLRLHRQYQELLSKYPMSVAEFESHCWHQNPRPTSPEIMEMALAISEEEWLERESKAKANFEQKKRR